MARKRKTRKRHKKGGYDPSYQPSPEQLGANEHGITPHRYVQLRRWKKTP